MKIFQKNFTITICLLLKIMYNLKINGVKKEQMQILFLSTYLQYKMPTLFQISPFIGQATADLSSIYCIIKNSKHCQLQVFQLLSKTSTTSFGKQT